MDLTKMTDAEINKLQRDVTTEQQHRAVLTGIPLQVAELAEQYRAGGGNPDDLIDALTPTDEEDGS